MKEILKNPVVLFMSLSVLAMSTSLTSSLATTLILLVTVVIIMTKDGFVPWGEKPVRILLLFYFVVVLYALMGHGKLNTLSFRAEMLSVITTLSCFILSFHIKKLNRKQISVLMGVFIVCLIFSIAGTTYVGEINPMALRTFGFGDVAEVDMAEAEMYRSFGMMGYGLAHAMSVVSVGLSALICYAPKKWLKILSIVMLFFLVRLLFIMTITTAMILAVIGSALVFANYLAKGKTVWTLVLVFIAVAVGGSGLMIAFLSFTQDVNSQLSAKLFDLVDFVQTGSDQGQASYRQYLYSVSFNTFLRNPFFGWGTDNGSRTVIGEHSYFLDYLAYYGLFSLLLIVAWWKEFQNSGLWISKQLKSCYYFSFIPVIGIIVLKSQSVCGKLPFFSLVFLQILFIYLNDERENVV